MQPGKRLVGKVAIVTGGASGIGAETARMFGQHGAKVLLTDSNAALGKGVAKEITDSGGTATFATQDVRDEAQWAATVAQAEKSYGRLDILCNIAGISGRDPKLNIQTTVTAGPRLAEQTLEQWNRVMEINATGRNLSITDTVVFDKTGTLTYGRPTVTDLVAFGASRDDVLSFAAAVEASSEHPLGQAIAFFAQREGVAKLAAADFRAHPGKGVTATVSGVEVTAGKPRFVEERGVRLSDEVRGRIARLSAEGKTVVVIARGGEPIGVVALQDTPRRGARRLIEKLRARGINTVMLTGDARPVGEAVGRLLGVDEVQAELLPPQKVAAIEVMQRDGRKVAMVGDGVNDAPALAQADVGIAIGAGTDVAIESAGVILVSDRLIDVLNAFLLGKASYRTLTGNVVVAVLQHRRHDARRPRAGDAALRDRLHGREHRRNPTQHAPGPGDLLRARGRRGDRAARRTGASRPEHGLRGLRREDRDRASCRSRRAGGPVEGAAEARLRALRADEGRRGAAQGCGRPGRLHRARRVTDWRPCRPRRSHRSTNESVCCACSQPPPS